MEKGRQALERAREELEQEHVRIRRLVGELVGSRDRTKISEVLTGLHRELKQHFAHEENPGGLYDSLGACTPDHRDELRALVDDHYQFLATVRALEQEARKPQAMSSADLVRRCTELADRLGAHERREHAMAEQALAGD